ncbi:MAG: DNA-protecting protein DprA [Deltaproteobacteria bacterium]|nr:DNA-protecting protein DprA [Deltaproteobacteria bacterium]
MESGELKWWLALRMVKGVGRGTFRALLNHFGEPKRLFDSKGDVNADGVSSQVISTIRRFKGWDRVAAEILLLEREGVRVVTMADSEYPDLLKATHDPPPFFYAKGDLNLLSSQAVAVVGTRHPTHYGRRMSETLGRDLALAGVTVVSGMARGCDAAAHRGALSAKGKTVAVLGTGINLVYPRENRRLYEEIGARGLLVSEFSMNTPPHHSNFPQRNRIISGLSLGVVVIEAPLRSGAIITANCALDCGREVFALPGEVTSVKSGGTNRLIRDGAMVVESCRDIVETLSLVAHSGSTPAAEMASDGAGQLPELEVEEEAIVRLLTDEEPLSVDGIIQKMGVPAQRVLGLLLEMELKGIVRQYPGKYFARRV